MHVEEYLDSYVSWLLLQQQMLLHTEETCAQICLLFVFGEIFAVLFGLIWIHYSAHHSDRIEYE